MPSGTYLPLIIYSIDYMILNCLCGYGSMFLFGFMFCIMMFC